MLLIYFWVHFKCSLSVFWAFSRMKNWKKYGLLLRNFHNVFAYLFIFPCFISTIERYWITLEYVLQSLFGYRFIWKQNTFILQLVIHLSTYKLYEISVLFEFFKFPYIGILQVSIFSFFLFLLCLSLPSEFWEMRECRGFYRSIASTQHSNIQYYYFLFLFVSFHINKE